MGELFADMEKMDIQAERRKTEAERNRADEVQKVAAEERRRADNAQKLASEEKNRADNAQKLASEEKKRADTAEENSVKLLVELCRELGASRDAAVQSLMDKKNMSHGEAREKAELYWKDSSES